MIWNLEPLEERLHPTCLGNTTISTEQSPNSFLLSPKVFQEAYTVSDQANVLGMNLQLCSEVSKFSLPLTVLLK